MTQATKTTTRGITYKALAFKLRKAGLSPTSVAYVLDVATAERATPTRGMGPALARGAVSHGAGLWRYGDWIINRARTGIWVAQEQGLNGRVTYGHTLVKAIDRASALD